MDRCTQAHGICSSSLLLTHPCTSLGPPIYLVYYSRVVLPQGVLVTVAQLEEDFVVFTVAGASAQLCPNGCGECAPTAGGVALAVDPCQVAVGVEELGARARMPTRVRVAVALPVTLIVCCCACWLSGFMVLYVRARLTLCPAACLFLNLLLSLVIARVRCMRAIVRVCVRVAGLLDGAVLRDIPLARGSALALAHPHGVPDATTLPHGVPAPDAHAVAHAP